MTETVLGNKSAKDLAGFIDRIEGLIAEKQEVAERIKSEYAEAAGTGFDKKALQQIIKERAADSEKTIQHRSIVHTYRQALGGLAGTPLGDWARTWLAQDERLKRHAHEASTALDEFLAKAKKQDEGGGGDAE